MYLSGERDLNYDQRLFSYHRNGLRCFQVYFTGNGETAPLYDIIYGMVMSCLALVY